jgi:hypothetical protein
MAVVGEAYILVRAITTEIKKDIANGFEGVRGQSTKEGTAAGQAFGKGFGNKMRDEATASAKAFHQLMRRGYAVQAGIGAAATSISALIGGLGALGGALIGAAASGIALVGVMAQIKVAGMVGKMAFKGVMEAVKKTGNEGTKSLRELREEMQQLAFDAEQAALSEESAALKLESARETLARVQDLPPNNRARREAELAYKEAELSYRRAKDKNNDLQEELANPKKTGKNNTDDPYKDLTKTQKAFAIYLKGVMPRMKELREAAASSFLPELTKQMKIMFAGGYFQMLVKGFKDVSAGLGKAVEGFAGTLFDPRNKKNLGEFFKSTGNTIGTMGRVVGNFFGIFLTLLKAADPLITRFVSFLDRKSFTLGDASRKNFTELNTFFKNAGDVAATFGRFLSNIFQPFKRLVMSQVGPGSPGREFVEWMQESTESLREFKMGADGLTLNEKLAPAVENTKAIFSAFSGFAGAFLALGQNPGVKEFWDTLAKGSGSVETILNNMASTTGPALANVIVRLIEVIAAFSDSGQINAYFDVLAEVFRIFAQVAIMFGNLLKAIGPLTGALGALITSWILLKKAMMLMYGQWGILRGAMLAMTTLTYKQIFAAKAKNTVDAFSLLMQKKTITAKQTDAIMTYRQTIAESTNMGTRKKNQALKVIDNLLAGKSLTAKQAVIAAEMKDTLQKNLNSGATIKNMAAARSAALANGTVTGSFLAEGAAAAGATVPVTAFGIALNSALWPIIAVAAVVALAIGGIAWLIGKHNDDVKNATAKTQKALTDTKNMGVAHNEQLRHSQNAWNEAIGSSWESTSKYVMKVNDLGDVTKALIANQVMSNTYMGRGYQVQMKGSEAVGQYKEALHNMGTALGNIAKKNLPAAQQQFIRFANASELSKEGLQAQLHEMPDFQAQLKKTAEKYKLVTDKMSDQEKEAVYLDIALNRGAYATAKMAEAQRKLGQDLQNAAASFIDVKSPLESVTKKGQVDLNAYKKQMKTQIEAQNAWYANLTNVQAKGISMSSYKALIGMGKEGADLVASLAKSSKEDVMDWERQFAQTTPDFTAGLSEALTQPEKVIELVRKKLSKGKFKGDSYGLGLQMRGIQEQLKNGSTTIGKLMADYGIDFKDIMQSVADSKPISQKVTWDGESIKQAQTDLADKLSGNYEIKINASKKANGGLIVTKANGGLMGFKNGGVIGFKNGGNILQRFAPGGQVFGQGGPRSDRIPAMLSNGEYVVNAAATARTLPLLNAINYGVTQQNANAGTMVGGGGGSLMNSVNITVNPSPGMDETELAAMVSRELSAQMRRGASS